MKIYLDNAWLMPMNARLLLPVFEFTEFIFTRLLFILTIHWVVNGKGKLRLFMLLEFSVYWLLWFWFKKKGKLWLWHWSSTSIRALCSFVTWQSRSSASSFILFSTFLLTLNFVDTFDVRTSKSSRSASSSRIASYLLEVAGLPSTMSSSNVFFTSICRGSSSLKATTSLFGFTVTGSASGNASPSTLPYKISTQM